MIYEVTEYDKEEELIEYIRYKLFQWPGEKFEGGWGSVEQAMGHYARELMSKLNSNHASYKVKAIITGPKSVELTVLKPIDVKLLNVDRRTISDLCKSITGSVEPNLLYVIQNKEDPWSIEDVKDWLTNYNDHQDFKKMRSILLETVRVGLNEFGASIVYFEDQQ